MTREMNNGEVEFLPTAKSHNIVVQEIDNEILVYDLEMNKAHSLNMTASLVWRACTGKRTIEQIAQTITSDLKQNVSTEQVHLALLLLQERKLLVETGRDIIKKRSRRQLISDAALTATTIALPMVVSLLVPTALSAQSSACGGAIIFCGCNHKGANGGTCATSNCPSVCSTCGNLMGCNAGGNQCLGTCQ